MDVNENFEHHQFYTVTVRPESHQVWTEKNPLMQPGVTFFTINHIAYVSLYAGEHKTIGTAMEAIIIVFAVPFPSQILSLLLLHFVV